MHMLPPFLLFPVSWRQFLTVTPGCPQSPFHLSVPHAGTAGVHHDVWLAEWFLLNVARLISPQFTGGPFPRLSSKHSRIGRLPFISPKLWATLKVVFLRSSSLVPLLAHPRAVLTSFRIHTVRGSYEFRIFESGFSFGRCHSHYLPTLPLSGVLLSI